MKKILSLMTLVALLITLLPAQNTYAAESKVTTPADYVQYLKTQPDSADTVQQFEALSPADQQKYIKYVTDPALMEQVLQATMSGKPTTLANGDIKVNQSNEGLPHHSGGSVGTMETVKTVYQDFDSMVLGVNTFKYRITLTYSVGGTSSSNLQVRKAIGGNGEFLFSRIPGLSMSFTKDAPYVSNNTAVIKVYAHWDLVYQGSGARYGTDLVTLTGYTDGSKTWTKEQF